MVVAKQTHSHSHSTMPTLKVKSLKKVLSFLISSFYSQSSVQTRILLRRASCQSLNSMIAALNRSSRNSNDENAYHGSGMGIAIILDSLLTPIINGMDMSNSNNNNNILSFLAANVIAPLHAPNGYSRWRDQKPVFEGWSSELSAGESHSVSARLLEDENRIHTRDEFREMATDIMATSTLPS